MELIATGKQMQWCDRTAIEKCGIPSIVLMENAGRTIADVIEKEFGPLNGKLVYLMCGKGNNGGDGFVVARHLYNRGADVKVFLCARQSELKGDAKTNAGALLTSVKWGKARTIEFLENATAQKLKNRPTPQIIVDALFGTGFSGAVRGEYQKIIEWINASNAKVVAVDIPSGVNADNGRVENVAVHADVTVTMGLRKTGLLVHRGRECSGKVYVADIGIPRLVYERSGIRTWLVQQADVRRMLPRRPFDAHKHSVGKIFVLAGSRGLTGAAVMSCQSAMRAGAGAVVLGTPKSLLPIIAKKLTEVMPHPLEETEEQSVSMRALKEIDRFVRWCDLAIIGPGLGRNKETEELILSLIRSIDKPILVDADGLNALASDPSVLKKRKAEVILTPHTGELSRITHRSVEQIEGDRVEVARTEAKNLKSILVLKGAPTVTATPSGEVFVNSTGNAGMATAGAGDVLSGTIAALWGQHIPSVDAAICGVFLHGLAGDLAKDKYGEMSLVATDILECLPSAIRLTLLGDSH